MEEKEIEKNNIIESEYNPEIDEKEKVIYLNPDTIKFVKDRIVKYYKELRKPEFIISNDYDKKRYHLIDYCISYIRAIILLQYCYEKLGRMLAFESKRFQKPTEESITSRNRIKRILDMAVEKVNPDILIIYLYDFTSRSAFQRTLAYIKIKKLFEKEGTFTTVSHVINIANDVKYEKEKDYAPRGENEIAMGTEEVEREEVVEESELMGAPLEESEMQEAENEQAIDVKELDEEEGI